MDALQFFWIRYTHPHAQDRPERRLLDADLRARPAGLNSVAWLVWHSARVEDVLVNRFVLDEPQVLDQGGWAARMGVPWRDIGAGMTSSEVDDLSARLDVAALWGYWDAVGEQTTRRLRALPATHLDAPIDPAHVRRVADEEGFVRPVVSDIVDRFARWPSRGAPLALVLAHNAGHMYDIDAVRGLLAARPVGSAGRTSA
jgi:hypothetical protein